ncbi:hypothetical protein [Tautonia sociabilis]|uniref:Uncharacterized protein n=1 Tax=Tautonia sociabilis TaxID=2080755 RepID=A0A432MQA0_9BACT|nr:hypothetical protein [Tautonia sociabilis]RUL89419.1 hypothetical protein TsocGM_01210 [Tautonia sociabilis]
MDGNPNESQRSVHSSSGSPATPPSRNTDPGRPRPSRFWTLDQLHLQGWIGYLIALLVLLTMLIIAGRAVTSWMLQYSEASSSDSAEP